MRNGSCWFLLFCGKEYPDRLVLEFGWSLNCEGFALDLVVVVDDFYDPEIISTI